ASRGLRARSAGEISGQWQPPAAGQGARQRAAALLHRRRLESQRAVHRPCELGGLRAGVRRGGRASAQDRGHETMMVRVLLSLCALLGAGAAIAPNKYFADWPSGADPREVGKRIAERFIPTPHMEIPSLGPQALHYSHVATWTGALQFADVTKDEDLTSRLAARFEPFLAPEAPRVPRGDHVDAEVFGSLPLQLYLQTHRYQYRVMGLAF